jgi:nitrite reductase/ring-hydroxylating ferredoxin subunit
VERIDRMTEAPVPGKFYLVPVVRAKWYWRTDEWPVIGPSHNDVEFLNFDKEHYHIDGRFLTKSQREYAHASLWHWSLADSVQRAPIEAPHNGGDLPAPTLKRRKCWMSDIEYVHGDKAQVQNIRKHFAGQHCAKGKSGWICPHRKAPLGSVAVIDGVITCPLHGLRIDASTGKCLGTESVMGRDAS